jgi:hypothetical protein
MKWYIGIKWGLIRHNFTDIFIVEHNILREYFNTHVESFFFFLLEDNQFELFFPFKNLVITGTLGLQDFLMDIHYDTSLRSILEDDSISLTSKTCICSCLGKGARLWLIIKPSIYSFRITHFIFTLALFFHFGLIQLWHLVFSFVNVDMGSMHLACI